MVRIIVADNIFLYIGCTYQAKNAPEENIKCVTYRIIGVNGVALEQFSARSRAAKIIHLEISLEFGSIPNANKAQQVRGCNIDKTHR